MTDQSAALLAAYRLGVQHGGQIEQSLFGSGSGGTSGSAPERQSPAGDQNGGLPLDDTRPDTKGEATGGRGHFPDSRNRQPQRECLVGGWRVGKQPPLALTDEERRAVAASICHLRQAACRLADLSDFNRNDALDCANVLCVLLSRAGSAK
jgi:hypothetical protein